jgi:WD40 repeat protein
VSDARDPSAEGRHGCCETPPLAYPAHFNRPGLGALAYRLATHSGFLERMLARLTRDQLPDEAVAPPGQPPLPEGELKRKRRPLAALSTREPSDPSIALLDAWAAVADVLTFYQERIANEGFLRTATERRSVLELARAIGYELKPGVAASTVLAFIIDSAKDSPREVRIARGTRVLSIPVKDEPPQPFETTEEVVARAAWNALEPHTPLITPSHSVVRSVNALRLKGTATGLRPGDAVLIVGDERRRRPGDEHWDFRILDRVEAVPEKSFTRIGFALGLGDQHPTDVGPAQANPRVLSLRLRAALFGHNAAEWDRLDPDLKRRHAPGALEVITGAALSSDGKRTVCATVDGTLRLWNAATGEALDALTGHVGSANCAVFTPDDRQIVSGGDDGTVRVWDTATGNPLRSFTGHKGPVLSVACASYLEEYEDPRDQKPAAYKRRTRTIVVSGGADTDILVWTLDEPPPGELRVPGRLAGHSGAVNSLALHVAEGIYRVPALPVQRLLSGGDDGNVFSWNLAPGGELRNSDGRVTWWNVADSSKQTVGTHAGAVKAVALRKSGPDIRIASGGADGQLKGWSVSASDAFTPRTFTSGTAVEAVTALAFSPAADKVLAGKADGVLLLWDWASGVPATTRSAAHEGPVTALAWAQALILTGGADRKLMLRNTALTPTRTLASREAEDENEWPGFPLRVNSAQPEIELDAVYPSIVPDSWIVLARPGYAEAYRVLEADVRWASGFGLSSKVTRLRLDSAEHLTWFGRRNTTVHAQSEPLDFYVETQDDRSPLHGAAIQLSGLVQGLDGGRRVVATGQRMRARIEAGVTKLVSEDGYSSRDVAPGDVLVCLSPPRPSRPDYALRRWRIEGEALFPVIGPASGGAAPQNEEPAVTLRWKLRDRNGFEGYAVSTAATQIAVLRPRDDKENRVSEVAVLERVVEVGRVRSELHFADELENLYDYDTLKINANAARATHGETVAREVLGSGDGTQGNQSFALRKKPLTYVSAPTPSGGESTLEVRVNDVLWKEAQSLHELDGRSQSYLVRHDDKQSTRIVFGDGVRGARLPTGQENVIAAYRAGLGPEGEVAAEAIKLLQTKPLGVREAINPVPATGAAPPEPLSEARAHAPLTVLTLERVVSLKDYGDFAAGFAGVGKAQAAALWTGSQRLVHITVATASGQPLAAGSALHDNLAAAFASLRDAAVPVRIQGFALRHFQVVARVRIDARYRWTLVEQQIRAALSARFSFERRDFGQPVTRAEVIAAMQNVPGVVGVDLTGFALVAGEGPVDPATLRAGAVDDDEEEEVLPAQSATWDPDLRAPRPALLLLLFPTTDGVALVLE